MKVYNYRKIPAVSSICNDVADIDFFDSYMVVKQTDLTAGELVDRIFTLPRWVKLLLTIRHYLLVLPLGLNAENREMPLILKSENEVILGENDKHLYFRLSILKENGLQSKVFFTTIVKFNNNFGKFYFSLIKPFHKLIVKSMLKKI